MQQFDLVVVGGGHAGLEACWCAAQFDLKVGLISMKGVPLGNMPCNPSIGGVGKGQVVREIDALGGLMPKLADKAAIQYRILNESKGYAVQSTRFQIDKFKYSEYALEAIMMHPRIKLINASLLKAEKVDGHFILTISEGGPVQCKKMVLTTGTFLNGLLHTGEEKTVGGVINADASVGLREMFPQYELPFNRFKTGTPPRVKRDSIDFSKFEVQYSDPRTQVFDHNNFVHQRFLDQVPCHMGHTTIETMTIIRDAKERSPLFNGQIKGIGPRYCPSIEDKAFRYPDRNVHHVFVEPEGLDSESTYLNGLSTSLPKDVQDRYVHSVEGLEHAEFLQYGYAVEYDVIDSSTLNRCLESQIIEGLYFAGQVNGTSGYEEAAAQGAIAGINAALKLTGKDELILDRHRSYIGVLIEDLVSNTRDEPYRLFTARSENRLYLREDNTFNRMGMYRAQMGLDDELDEFYRRYFFAFDVLDRLCDITVFRGNKETQEYFDKMDYGPIGPNISLTDLMKRAKLDPVDVLKNETERMDAKFDFRVIYAVAISKKYNGYIKRADAETERLRRLEKKIIHWEQLLESDNISFECKQRIKAVKPETFGQLMRIEGIRPATLAYVAGNIVK